MANESPHPAGYRPPGGPLECLARLIRKYATVPMSLADACLVRMAEVLPESTVLTLDRDFRLYRKGGWHVLPVIMPEDS
jgi:hypothetical protein